MLGIITAQGRGEADRLLCAVADQLAANGVRLAGVVQENRDVGPDGRCDMYLRCLGTETEICISQRLGPGSKGCRLDPIGLEQAAGIAEGKLAKPAQLLIINKFGKQELEGRGFRPLIGQALSEDIPVLIAVSQGHREPFEEFADDLAVQIDPEIGAVLEWVKRVLSGEN